MKSTAIALLAALALTAATAQARIIPWEKVSCVTGAGVAVPLNDEFDGSYKESVYRVLNIEAAIINNVAIYTTYDRANFDPVAGAEVGQIDVTTWGLGTMLFGNLNLSGSVRGFAKLGASSNTIKGETTEWTWQTGLGIDAAVSQQAGIRFACDFRTYSNSDRIESILPQILLRLSPGKSEF